jgi:hypothetical protein
MNALHPIFADAIAPFAPPPVRPDRIALTTFEAFKVSEPVKDRWNKLAPLQTTYALGPIIAQSVDEARAAALVNWCFHHKEQLVIRETSERGMLLHVFAVVRKPDAWVYDHNHIQQRQQRLDTKFLCVIDGGVVA